MTRMTVAKQVFFTSEMYEAVRDAAERQDDSIAGYIRKAVERQLIADADELWRTINAGYSPVSVPPGVEPDRGPGYRESDGGEESEATKWD